MHPIVGAKQKLISTTQNLIERRAFGLAHSIIANAGRVKDYLVDSGVPAAKIRVIHNGLDLKRLCVAGPDRGEILRELGLPSDPEMQFVTIVANLRSAVKNHRMFLRAAAKVKAKAPNTGFIVAGEGELADEMKAPVIAPGFLTALARGPFTPRPSTSGIPGSAFTEKFGYSESICHNTLFISIIKYIKVELDIMFLPR